MRQPARLIVADRRRRHASARRLTFDRSAGARARTELTFFVNFHIRLANA